LIQETDNKRFKIKHERDLKQIGESKSILIRVTWNANSQQQKPGLSLLVPIVVRENQSWGPSAGEHPATETRQHVPEKHKICPSASLTDREE
jgi:hypothetical protein